MNWASVFSGLFGALAGYTLAVALRALWVWWREPRKPDFPPSSPHKPINPYYSGLKDEIVVHMTPEQMAKHWPVENNVTHVGAYTRKKQTRKPKGSPK